MTLNLPHTNPKVIPSGIQKPHEPKPVIERHRLSTAELAECTCPEFCERDHDNE